MNFLYTLCFVTFQLTIFCTTSCPPLCKCISTSAYCKGSGLRYVLNEIPPNITQLYLSGNNISTLPSDAFKSLTSLKILYLNSNQISTIPSDVFKSLTSLTYLVLHNNQISTLPSDAFKPLTLLTSLHLGSNRITTLPSDVFKSLTSLTSLTLHNNQISTLPSDAFKPLTSLTSLHLGSNRITTLPSDAFKPLTSLKSLYLDSNRITTLPYDVFKSLTSLTFLSLNQNPLLCECSFVNYTKTLQIYGTCSDAVTGRRNVPLQELHAKDFCLNKTTTSTTTSATTTSATTTSATTVISTTHTETTSTHSSATFHPTNTLPTTCTPIVRIKLQGCFEHNVVKPIFIQHLNVRQLIDWNNLNATVDTCKYLVSKSKSKIFGIAFYGECWYGRSEENLIKSSDCYGPVGKERSIMVYTFV